MREWMAEDGSGLELYVVTPADLGVAFVVWLALIFAAMAGVWWVMRRPSAPVASSGESEEIRRRPRRHRTGTIHAPGVHVPADETVVIDTREAPR